MKKFILILTLSLLTSVGYSQCITGSSAGTLNPTLAYQTITHGSGNFYYSFTGVAGATYNFTYCSNGGSFTGDPMLTIADNSPTLLAVFDDACGLGTNAVWTCPANGTYRLYVHSYSGCTPAISRTLAYNVTATTIPLTGVCNSTVSYTSAILHANCGFRGGSDRLFQITIPSNGNWTFSTCGSSWDTWLFLSTAQCGGTILANNDDFCGLQSSVTVALTAGTYFVSIEGFNPVADYTAFTLNVSNTDVTPPTITCPGTQTLNLSGSCTATLPDYRGLASASDNCTGVTVTQSPAIGSSVSGVGTTLVTLTATDGMGNSSNCSFNVNRVDVTAPTLSCPANQTLLAGAGVCTANFTIPDPITDNCTGSTWGYTLSGATTGTVTGIADGTNSTPTFNRGVTTVTLTGTDGTNSATGCSFTVTVNDNQNPTITCPSNVTVNNTAGTCGATVTYAQPTFNDNCGFPSTSQTFNFTGGTQTFTVPAGITSITVKAWGAGGGGGGGDGFGGGTGGGGAYATSTLSVIPGQVLTIYVGGPGQQGTGCVTGTGGGNGGFGYGTAGRGGNAGVAGCSGAGAGGGGGSAVLLGGTPLIVAAGGGGGGGGGNNVLGGIGGGGGVNGGAAAGILGGTAGASGSINGANAANHGADGGGGGGGGGGLNGGAAGQTPGGDVSAGGGGGGNSLGSTINNGAGQTPGNSGDPLLGGTLARGGNGSPSSSTGSPGTAGLVNISWNTGVVLTAGMASGSTFPVGTTTNTYTATDLSGNVASCSFTVTVNDAQAPTITCPATQNLTLNASCQAVLPDYRSLATASDNCPGFTISQSPAPGTTVTGSGVQVITLTVTQASGGLTASCNFNVNKNDVTAPTLVCPANQTLVTAPGLCTANYTIVDPITDNCTGSTWGYTLTGATTGTFSGFVDGTNNVRTFNKGTTTVTLTGTDGTNTATGCSFTVTVNDNQAPTLVCPANQTLVTAPGVCTATFTIVDPITDNCTGSTWGYTLTGATTGTVTGVADGANNTPTFNKGTTTVTLTGTDGTNTATGCSFTVTVNDNQAPTLVCPANQTLVTAPGVCTATFTIVDPITDNCTGSTWGYTLTGATTGTVTGIADGTNNTPTFNRGVTTVTLTGTDGTNSATTCFFTVTVNDNQAPTLACPSNQVLSTSPGLCTANFTIPDPITDNCTGATWSYSTTGVTTLSASGIADGSGSGSLTFNKGVTNITINGVDASGNPAASCSFTITVNDNQPPTITCPPNQSFAAVAGSCGRTRTYALPTFSDNCPGVTMVQDPTDAFTSGDFFPVGVTTIHYIATDASGNTATCSFTITITDAQPPTIICPSAQNLPLNSSCQATLPDYRSLAAANDNCPGFTVSQSPAPGTLVSGTGVQVVTLTVTQASGGLTASCNFNVNKVDNTAPTITCPATQTLVLGGSCTAVLPNYTTGTATDNCTAAGSITYTQSPAAGSTVSGVGTTAVTITATDASGNSSNCTFNVNRVDNTAPTITCPATQTLNLNASCTATLPDYTGFATLGAANCGPAVVTQSPLPGTSVSGIGTTVVTLTATDGSGNTASCTFNVNRVDATSPTITCPATQTLTLGASCSATLPDYTGLATSSDNCSGVTITQSPASGTSVSGTGTMSVILTSTDGSGNTSSCTFTVTKVDNTAPAISCPSTQTLNLDAGCDAVLPNYTGLATASDNCGSVTVTQSPAIGTTITGVGALTVTLTATDAAGLTASCTFTVNKVDVISPTITCPASMTVNASTSTCGAVVTYTAPSASDNCSGTTQLVTNGGFESGFSSWSTSGSWQLNNGSLSPASGVGTTPPISGTEDAITNMSGGGTHTMFQTVNLSPTPTTYTLSWSDRIRNLHTAYVDPNQEFRVQFRTTSNVLIGTVYSTNPGDPLSQVGPNNRTFDVSAMLAPYAGQSVRLVYEAQVELFYMNVYVDNVSLTGGVSVTQTAGLPSGSTFPVGTTTNTFTATDGSGNTSTCSFNVTVVDNVNPTLTCPSNITVNNTPGACGAVVNYSLPVVSDNCPLNSSVQVYNIPLANLFNISANCGVAGSMYNGCGAGLTGFNWTDIGSGQVSNIQVQFSMGVECNSGATYTPLLNGNAGTPYAQTPQNCGCNSVSNLVTLNMPTTGYVVGGVNQFRINATNCWGLIPNASIGGNYARVTVTYSPLTQTAGLPPGSTFPIGTTTNTFIATDASGNLSVPCSFTVTVVDNENPVLNCPANITMNNDPGTCGAVVSQPTGIYCTNNNGGSLMKINPTTGVGTTIGNFGFGGTYALAFTPNGQAYTVINGFGAAQLASVNLTTGVATPIGVPFGFDAITLEADNTGQLWTVGSGNGNLYRISPTGVPTFVGFTSPAGMTMDIAFDNSNNLYAIHTTNRLYQINTTTGASTLISTFSGGVSGEMGLAINNSNSFYLTEYTSTPRLFSLNPTTGVCTFVGNIGGSFPHGGDFVPPIAMDNCTATVTNDFNGTSTIDGETFPVGTTSVVWTATDGSGNTSSCTQTITVNDNQVPVFASCTNIVVNNTPGACGRSVNYALPIIDNCPLVTTTRVYDIPLANLFNVGVSCGVGGSFYNGCGVGQSGFNWTDVGTGQVTGVQVQFSMGVECNFGATYTPLLNGNAGTPYPQTPQNCGCNTTSNMVTLSMPTTGYVVGGVNQFRVNTTSCWGLIPNATIGNNYARVTVTYSPIAQTDGTGLTSGNFFPIGTTVQSYTVTDAGGNTASCSFTVTVNDAEFPIITSCPSNITVSNAPGQCNNIVNWVAPTASDNCPGVVMTSNFVPGSTFPVGTSTVIYTATDASSNTTTCSFTVTVNDTEVPVATCQPVTVVLDGSGNGSTTAAAVNNGSSDNCSITSMTLSQTSFNCSNVGPNTVTLTVTDAAGNTATCSAIVTVVDNTLPTALCTPYTLVLNSSGTGTITAANVNGGSSDACGIATMTVSPSSFNCSNVGPNTVTLTVTDVNGNSSTCSTTVTVQDNTAPIAVCSPYTLQLDATGNGTITASNVDGGSNDACGIATMTVAPSSFNCSNVGANPVVLTVTDVNGNVSTCTATVTVQDNVAPNAICQPFSVTLNGSGTASINATDVNNGSNDACGISTMTVSPSTFNCSNVGSNTVTLTVTDVNGNIATCTSTVTVIDNIAPVAFCQPYTLVLDASGNGTLLPTDVNNSSSDNCGIVSMTVTPSTFTCANVGSNTVMLTVTDASGNTSTCTTNVTVQDNTNPVAICQPYTLVLNASGTGTITGADVNNGSSDACGIASMTVTPSAFNCSNVGANTVTLTVTDVNGHTATCSTTVTVQDNTAPTSTCQPYTLVLDGTGNGTITSANINNGSSDACGIATMTVSPSSFNCSNVGSNTVVLTVTDINGNVSTCSSVVTVVDNTAPTAPVLANATGECSVTVTAPTTADNCGTITGTTPSPLTYNTQGTYTIIWTFTDASGNTSTSSQTVIVDDVTAPVPNASSLPTATGVCSVTISAPTATDNCVGTVTATPASATYSSGGTFTHVWTFNDGNGNISTQTQTVIVSSPEADITGNGNPIVNTSSAYSLTNHTDFGSTSVCSGTITRTYTITNNGIGVLHLTGTPLVKVTGLNPGDFVVTSMPSASIPAGGSTTFNVTFNPSGSGYRYARLTINNDDCNESGYYFQIRGNGSGVDNTAPVPTLSTLPNVTGSCSATISATPTANDACTGLITGTTTSPLTYTAQGTYTVIWSYNDGNGNTSTQTQTVIVQDVTPPTAICQTVTLELDASGNVTLPASMMNNGSFDNCGPLTFVGIYGAVKVVNGTFNTNLVSWSTANGTTFQSTGGNPGGFAWLNGTGGVTDPSIQQTFSDLIPGQTYVIRGDFRSVSGPGSFPGQVAFAIDLDGTQIATKGLPNPITTWTPFSVTFTATSSTHTVRFRGEINGTDGDIGLDNVRIDGTAKNYNCFTRGTHTVTLIVSDSYGNTATCNSTVNIMNTLFPCPVALTFNGGTNESGEENTNNEESSNNTTSIENVNAFDGRIYPNPSNGIFNLELSVLPRGNAQIRVIDALGQVLYVNTITSQNTYYDFSYLRAATYYIQVITDEGNFTKPIIITHGY